MVTADPLSQDVSKLLKEFPNIPHVKSSMVEVFKRMRQNLGKSNG
jgi:hypothetical protein